MRKLVERELRKLADACSRGDADSMLALAGYLFEKCGEKNEAYNMWLLRAAIYGNIHAQEMVKEEIVMQHEFLHKMLIPYENFLPERRSHWYYGSYPGYLLNAAGLLAFKPDQIYLLSGIRESRMMVVWQEQDYEPPDEDGFGAESYYDMFCLDEFFVPLPGAPVVHRASSKDIRNDTRQKKCYDEMCVFMENAAQRREKRCLWTAFEELQQ